MPLYVLDDWVGGGTRFGGGWMVGAFAFVCTDCGEYDIYCCYSVYQGSRVKGDTSLKGKLFLTISQQSIDPCREKNALASR